MILYLQAAQFLSSLPPGHPALAALHPGGVNPFTHPEAYQNAVERLSAERLKAETFLYFFCQRIH